MTGDNFRFDNQGEDLETLRFQAQQLENTAVDIDGLSAFAPGKLEVRDIAGAIKPDAGPGLRVSNDLGKLEDGVRKLQEQEANARLRRLLDQAQQRMKQEKFHIAISLIDQALEIDGTSALAWLLKGQCFYALREFERALELIEQAMRHTPDGETRILAVILRAACERAISEAVEAELAKLLTAGNLAGAARLAKRTLQANPANVVVRYYQCVILLMLNRVAEAKAAVAAALAMDTVSGSNAESFERLLQQILVVEFQPQLERVREYLRYAKPKAAVKVLESCPPNLRGDEQVEALRSFAYERVGHETQMFRGLRVHMGQRRMRAANVPPLAPDLLQPLLCWLLHDELKNGIDAMNNSKWGVAEQSFVRAGQIDDRSTVVAYLHAIAVLRGLEEGFGRKRPPTLEAAEDSLDRAERLVERAQGDPLVRDEAGQLAKAIQGYRRQLGEVRASVEKMRAINECVNRFNTLVGRYRHRPITSYAELTQVKVELRRLRDDVTRLRRRHSVNSEQGRALDELARTIEGVQRQLG